MPDSPLVSLPLDLVQALAPFAAQLGISEDLPGMSRFAPEVDVCQPIRMLALDLGRLLAKQLLFVRGEDVVTVDEETGEIKPMTPKRFVGWVEDFCAFKYTGRSQRTRNSLTREEADVVLNQDIFRSSLRELAAVHTMRLPVLRPQTDGPVKIELLEPGYDEQSKVYTVERLKYELDWPIDQAKEWLHLHGHNYPLAWPDDVAEDARKLTENRSWGVQMFAMLGVYCKAMFAAGTVRPMITYLGNQPGTGKSTLAAMALMPVFGHASTTGAPSTDENMDKVLETVAQTRQPYLFLDDVRYGLDSAPLNRFLSSARHGGRVMGGNKEMFTVDNVTQVFATGNALKVTSDLMRRSLIVDLFLPGDVRGRKYDIVINPQYLARDEIRAKFLAAMWALVRTYRDQVAEMGEDFARHQQPLESFEVYSGLIGQMVIAAGYSDPLKQPDIAPNENEDEMRTLLVKAASSVDAAKTFDRKELIEIARANGLLEGLVGAAGDGDLDAKGTKRWGRQLQAWRGRELVDERGRRFRFGHKRQKTGATYPLAFL